MARDKEDKGKFRVLASLGQMLGLTGDAFVNAMKEAVWVPGGVDQLADLIVRTLSPDEVARLIQELPDVAEVMALIGRLLIALNDRPDREALGRSVIQRARQLGPEAVKFLSPYSWYPPVDQIQEILVSPYRLHAASLMMRMRWGGPYEGIEAIWLLRFSAGAIGEAYFVTDSEQQDVFKDMVWKTLTMDEALSLLTLVGMVQSAVNNRFPFDGMVGVGLWMVLAGGREVKPWIDGSYLLENEILTPLEVAMAYENARNNADYAACYDMLMDEARPTDILDYIAAQERDQAQTGDLWRLQGEILDESSDAVRVALHGWYRPDEEELVERVTTALLRRDSQGYWRIAAMSVSEEGPVNDADLAQYLAMNPRYFALAPVEDMDALAELLPGPSSLQQQPGVFHFSQGMEFDYRRSFDIGSANDMEWTLMADEPQFLLIFARDEVSLRRELARLEHEQAIGQPDRLGVVDLPGQEAMQDAAEEGVDALYDVMEEGE
ncbi:hypothetical protein [Sulfobacillus harzensis]|uniref:Uncharacterized protein n=1 Tax=Sulfobacillus harzensis TaxID=2729629 RepID=A0A7Y0L194_9FIRM|nr:hypothetical protein [Sulfobacillus harzensis]NMP20891.1 hypothetical protein [Sulfobacillus harzensis]